MNYEKMYEQVYEQTKPALVEMLKAGFTTDQIAAIVEYGYAFAVALQGVRVEISQKRVSDILEDE